MPKPPPSRPRSATPAPHGPALRREVWEELRAVARPDARFHLTFSDFIPDFDGSEDANARLWQHPASSKARHVFATPDNSLIGLRRHVLAAGLGLVVSSFNMARGFLYFAPGSVPKGQELFAAWPDGLEHFARPLDLPALAELGRFDLVVTGASAVAASGVRFGRGHGWFDLEWLLFAELGLVQEATPIATLVHDVQVLDAAMFASPDDVLVDIVCTPTRTLEVQRTQPRPRRIDWSRVDDDQLATPALAELRRAQGLA